MTAASRTALGLIIGIASLAPQRIGALGKPCKSLRGEPGTGDWASAAASVETRTRGPVWAMNKTVAAKRPRFPVPGSTATLCKASLAAQPVSTAVLAERITSVASIVGGESPIWKPDGTTIYFSSPLGGLWSVPTIGGSPTRVARDLPGGLVRLAPDGASLAFLSDKSGNPEIWLWDLRAGTERRLTNLGARINALNWSPDGRHLAFSALRYGQFDLWTAAVASGTITRVTDDSRYETYPTWLPDGRSILFFRSDDRWADHEVMIVPAEGGAARTVATDRDLFDYGTIGTRSKMGYPLLSPDGRTVLFKSHRSGWINYWVASLEGGPVHALSSEPADQSDAKWAPDGKSVVYGALVDGTQQLRITTIGGPVRSLTSHETGVASAPEWSPDGKRIAYFFASATQPQDLFVIAAGGGPPTQLTVSIDPGIAKTLVVPEKVSYRSGPYTIHAYLFRPPTGLSTGRSPGVMYIHGGPTAQFSDTYQPQPQFLAQAGYLVLAPNIRGSSGYGKAFEDANNPCWTHCDLEDVLAGVGYLKGLPNLDASRIGVTGNSYGGIMSMGAVAHAPGVFQAAIPQSGYANWVSFQDYNTEIQHAKLNAYEWGPYPDSAQVYRRNSAIFSAQAVTTPVFLIQGDGVTQPWRPGVYPIPASAEFAHALDRYNKVVKVKTYPGESYYVTGRENSKQVLIDMAEFFDQYLRDRLGAPGYSAAAGRP